MLSKERSTSEKGNSLFASFSWIFMARLVYFGCQWGVLIALAHSLGVSSVGEWGLALAVTSPVFAFLDFKMRWIIATDPISGVSVGNHLMLRFGTIILSLAAIFVLSIALGLSSNTLSLVAVIATAKSVECFIELLYGVMQSREKMRKIAISLLIRGPCSLLTVVVLLGMFESAAIAASGMVVVWSLSLAFWDIPITRMLVGNHELRPTFSLPRIKQIIHFAAPLGVVALATALGRSVPRYVLYSCWGEEAVGYFTAIAYIQVAGDLLIISLAQAAIARLGRLFRSDLSQFISLLARLTAIGLGVGGLGILGSVLFGPLFLHIVYGPDYAVWSSAFVVIAIASTAACVNGLLGATLLAVGKPRLWMFSALVGLGFGTFGAFALIPTQSVFGGAVAVAISAWVALLFSLAAIIRVLTQAGWHFQGIRLFQAPDRLDGTADGQDQENNSQSATTRRLKVLRLVLSIEPTSAPYNQFTLPQLKQHDITVCAFNKSETEPEPGFQYIACNGALWTYILLVRRLLLSSGYDVVHLHSPHVAVLFFLASTTCFFKGWKRSVLHVHNSYKIFRPRNRCLLLIGFFFARRIACCSQSSGNSFPIVYRILAGKRLRVVRNAFNTERVERICNSFVPPCRIGKPLRIIGIGSLQDVKNHEMVLKSLSCVPELDIEVAIIGSGPRESDLRALAQEIRIANRVHFIGRIPREDVYRELLRSDIFVSMSYGEGLPIAVLEAMACGLPAILSNIPPHRESGQDCPGVRYVDPSDVSALVFEIRRFANFSMIERQSQGYLCKKHVLNEFPLTSMLDPCNALFLEVAGRSQAVEIPKANELDSDNVALAG